MPHPIPVYALVLAAVALAGCGSLPSSSWQAGTEITGATTPTMQNPGDVKYFPSDAPLRMGQEHFNRGDYGTSERYFRDAVEKAPRDVTAWIGLAAAYDRLSRFDLADQAYRQAINLGGETPQLLNNLGYSYMLRGNLTQARVKFSRAMEHDPNNPTIRNNMELLNASYRFIQREPATAQ